MKTHLVLPIVAVLQLSLLGASGTGAFAQVSSGADAMAEMACLENSLEGVNGAAGHLKKFLHKMQLETERRQEIPTYMFAGSYPYMFDADYDPFDQLAVGYGAYEGVVPGAELPPRADKMTDFMRGAADAFATITEQSGSLRITASVPDEEKAQVEVLQNTVSSMSGKMAKLGQLLKGPPYDKAAIQKLATELTDDSVGLEDLSKRVQKLVKRDEKGN